MPHLYPQMASAVQQVIVCQCCREITAAAVCFCAIHCALFLVQVGGSHAPCSLVYHSLEGLQGLDEVPAWQTGDPTVKLFPTTGCLLVNCAYRAFHLLVSKCNLADFN